MRKKFNGIIKNYDVVEQSYIKDKESRDKTVIKHTLDMLKYIGHNELDIKDSPSSYAILFE